MRHKNIEAEEIVLGDGVVIHPTASIRGLREKARRIELGDHVYIGESVQIICDRFSLGDYSKIHHHTNVHGYKDCRIGHNAWIGQYSIIDCVGGTEIGDNCGIGAHSQLWSHIKYGDTLEGCRFLSDAPLTIGNDVWFVGHCIVSPITAEDRSMALVGSVVTKDMKYNQIYAGCPARSVSERMGGQFREVSVSEKMDTMRRYLSMWQESPTEKIRIVENADHVAFDDERTYFAVADRKYKKTGSREEVSFMKFLLPEKAKFTPFG